MKKNKNRKKSLAKFDTETKSLTYSHSHSKTSSRSNDQTRSSHKAHNKNSSKSKIKSKVKTNTINKSNPKLTKQKKRLQKQNKKGTKTTLSQTRSSIKETSIVNSQELLTLLQKLLSPENFLEPLKTLSPRQKKSPQVCIQFLKQHFFNLLGQFGEVKHLQSDASTRTYSRFTFHSKSNSEPNLLFTFYADNFDLIFTRFKNLQQHLASQEIRTPHILAHSQGLYYKELSFGVVVQEDLGDLTLHHALNEGLGPCYALVPSQPPSKFQMESQNLRDAQTQKIESHCSLTSHPFTYFPLKIKLNKDSYEALEFQTLKSIIMQLSHFHIAGSGLHSNSPMDLHFEPFQLYFDLEKFNFEINFTLTHFYAGKHKYNTEKCKRLFDHFQPLLLALVEAPVVLTHRDLHGKNILWVGSNKEHIGPKPPALWGFIDFQDARMGLMQYDLASLLYDCYHRLDSSTIQALTQCYQEEMTKTLQGTLQKIKQQKEKSLSSVPHPSNNSTPALFTCATIPPSQLALLTSFKQLTQQQKEQWIQSLLNALKPEIFNKILDWMAVQRSFKAIGSFAMLDLVQGKSHYLPYIGNAMENIKQLLAKYPELNTLRKLIAEVM